MQRRSGLFYMSVPILAHKHYPQNLELNDLVLGRESGRRRGGPVWESRLEQSIAVSEEEGGTFRVLTSLPRAFAHQ